MTTWSPAAIKQLTTAWRDHRGTVPEFNAAQALAFETTPRAVAIVRSRYGLVTRRLAERHGELHLVSTESLIAELEGRGVVLEVHDAGSLKLSRIERARTRRKRVAARRRTNHVQANTLGRGGLFG